MGHQMGKQGSCSAAAAAVAAAQVLRSQWSTHAPHLHDVQVVLDQVVLLEQVALQAGQVQVAQVEDEHRTALGGGGGGRKGAARVSALGWGGGGVGLAGPLSAGQAVSCAESCSAMWS